MTLRPLLVLASVVVIAAGVGEAAKTRGYLADGAFDVLAVLPPAPTPGDARDAADRAIFKATRKLEGTPRYDLATRDVATDQGSLMADFSCAAGVALTPQDAPLTAALESRAQVDTIGQMSRAKDHYRRKRPYLVDPGEICQSKAELADSYDYPSGHTTMGWTWALILSDLLPDRATAILARGRAYGESRFICGAHNYSAVEGGRTTATATMEAVRQTADYQADATAARAELRALIADPKTPRPGGCDAERALVAQRVP